MGVENRLFNIALDDVVRNQFNHILNTAVKQANKLSHYNTRIKRNIKIIEKIVA